MLLPRIETPILSSQSQRVQSSFFFLNSFEVSLSGDALNSILFNTLNECFETQQSVFPNIFPNVAQNSTSLNFLSNLHSFEVRYLEQNIEIANLSQPIQITIPLLPNLNANLVPSLNITDSSNDSSFQCFFWNEKNNYWDTNGCKLVSINPSFAICECIHLTTFVIGTENDLLPPFNDIDPSNLNSEFGSNNFAIPIIIGVIILVFISSLIIICLIEFIRNRDALNIPQSTFQQKIKRKRKSFWQRTFLALKYRHSLIGIITWREEDPFNRKQRLTLFIMKILLMFTFCAVFLNSNQSQFGEINLIACIGLSIFSSLISTPSLILMFFFQFSEQKEKKDENLPQLCEIPHFFLYVGYVVSILVILACTVVSILYSFIFTQSQMFNWLISFAIAVPQNLVINEPLRILFFAFLKHIYLVRIKHSPSLHLEDIFQSDSVLDSSTNLDLSEFSSPSNSKFNTLSRNEINPKSH